MKTIHEIRKEIDIIDRHIFELLRERLKLVIKTLDASAPLEDLSREDEIFRTICEFAQTDFEDRYIGNIYRTVFTEGKKIKEIISKGISDEK